MTKDAAGISYKDEVRRKVVHLGSLWIPLVICFLPVWLLIAGFGIAALGAIVVERLYALGNRHIVRWYDFFFGGMLRKRPDRRQWIVSGGPYVLLAAWFAVMLFPAPVAAAAMAAMLTGDTAAALVGRRWGRHKTVNGKSFEGTAAFILFGWVGAAVFLAICHVAWVYYLWAVPGLILAALAELFEKQLHIDDNFSIPAAVGLVLLIPCFLS